MSDEPWAGIYRGPTYDSPPPAKYVGYVGETCRNGCQAARLTRVAENAVEQVGTLLEREQTRMQLEQARIQPTRALWCEQGEHSFSEKDRGQQVITIAAPASDDEPESRTMCGPCAAALRTSLTSPGDRAPLPGGYVAPAAG